jgi:hypothetical protein
MDQTAAFSFVPSDELIKSGISFCTFDFAGCGKGTAPILTMGYREKDEMSAVIDHLRTVYKFEKVCLWGLSMGVSYISRRRRAKRHHGRRLRFVAGFAFCLGKKDRRR